MIPEVEKEAYSSYKFSNFFHLWYLVNESVIAERLAGRKIGIVVEHADAVHNAGIDDSKHNAQHTRSVDYY